MRILENFFKYISVAAFFILIGGIIFEITHIDLGDNPRVLANEVGESGVQMIYNSNSLRSVIDELSAVDGVNMTAAVEIDDCVLIGIDSVTSDAKYIESLKIFSGYTVMEHTDLKIENVFVEINNSTADDILELAYYSSKGVDANILNIRFNNIFGKLSGR